MMRQAATSEQSKAAPDKILPAPACGSFLVAVPFPAASPPRGHLSRDDAAKRQAAVVAEAGSGRAVGRAAAETRGDGEDDAELLRAVQTYLRRLSRRSAPGASERGCWESFYEQYDPLIRRAVRSWRLSHADTDDCIQEVWAELIAKLADLEYDPRKGRLRSWLFTFARRKVIRFLRGKRRVVAQALADPAKLADRDGDPSLACQRQEAGEIALGMLSAIRAQVSEVNYRVLQLRWIDGCSSTEIAALVDLTQDQVRWRLHRMQRKLKRLIAARAGGGLSAAPRR